MNKLDGISFTFEEVNESNVDQHHQTMIQLLELFDLTTSILENNDEYQELIIKPLIEIFVSSFSMINIYNTLEKYEYSKELYEKLKFIYITTMNKFQPNDNNEEIFNKLFQDLSDKLEDYLND
jgi:hypothetical protein